MRTRSKRLWFALPFLLVVPLSLLKWRLEWKQDHPPISATDNLLRFSLHDAFEVRIEVRGKSWQHRVGMKDRTLVLKDPAIFHKITETLRSNEGWTDTENQAVAEYITLNLLRTDSQTHVPFRTTFFYWHNSQGSYLKPQDYLSYQTKAAKVNPRFAFRFEALIASLVQQAQVNTPHPALRLTSIPPKDRFAQVP